MDAKEIWTKIKEALLTFWQWLKPYLQQFHQWRKRVWKKYHVNKIIILLGLITVLGTSSYLFYLSKQVDVDRL
ncbi:MAG: penicillin-binding protein, partial [Enterococcus sp.]